MNARHPLLWLLANLVLACSGEPRATDEGAAAGHPNIEGSAGRGGAPMNGGAPAITGGTAGSGSSSAGTGTGGTGGTAGNETHGSSGAAGAPASPCTQVGWCELPGTDLKAVCPAVSPGGATGCAAVTESWSGGIADTDGQRLIVWGGGHNDYWGNEVYALNLGGKQLTRLNEPSPTTNVPSCPETLTDGTPSSRHTYNGLAYLTHAKRMFAFGGGKSSCGYLSTGTWTLDLATLKWTTMDPHQGGTPAGNPGVVADYDPNTQLVFLHDGVAFWKYDFGANTYAKLKDDIAIDYHLNAVIDPKRKLFVALGGNEAHVISIAAGSPYTMSTPALKGCSALVDALYPGLAYDSKRDRIVGWAGGNAVSVLDLDTLTCTQVSHAGGPGPQRDTGTNGRFRYFPALDVYAVVNAPDANAFALRLP